MRTRSRKPSDDPRGKRGRVTLVGAGPGDPELLTIKAVRAMQEADIILFDALVSEEVLAFARSNAKRMLVGKRGHRPSCRQEDINDLMLKLARQGKHVVRLKCGDPVLFGRAGEEIAHLAATGIPVTIVPGITSASAMASLLNVSLTHRDHAQSVRFVTGHAKDGDMPADMDWGGIADPSTTLVIYMGGRTGSAIGQRLVAEGLAEATPCVVATSVSRPEGKRCLGTLGALARGELETAGGEPVLIGIGAVFSATASMPSGVWPAAACQRSSRTIEGVRKAT